jgi:hypothetical protein
MPGQAVTVAGKPAGVREVRELLEVALKRLENVR